MAIDPLNLPQQTAFSSFDFTPLMQLGKQYQQQQQAEQLASLGSTYGALPSDPTTAVPGSTTAARAPLSNEQDLMANQGSNAKSWYDFAVKPAEQGGLGLTPSQAAGKVANLQAESGITIRPWGVTGDQGTAWGAAQWRGDRLNNLQKFSADHGMDYRTTAAQQAFMRHEYLGSGPLAVVVKAMPMTP